MAKGEVRENQSMRIPHIVAGSEHGWGCINYVFCFLQVYAWTYGALLILVGWPLPELYNF